LDHYSIYYGGVFNGSFSNPGYFQYTYPDLFFVCEAGKGRQEYSSLAEECGLGASNQGPWLSFPRRGSGKADMLGSVRLGLARICSARRALCDLQVARPSSVAASPPLRRAVLSD